jgi:hypothetical protein
VRTGKKGKKAADLAKKWLIYQLFWLKLGDLLTANGILYTNYSFFMQIV